ncbi:MAG TPA: hypothetical protein VNL18_09185, partial [Gemmatimonadales bacterium]|nr:hypothetical protein [Gemmatimonadales bacterium]
PRAEPAPRAADALSPARLLRELAEESPSQRVGDSGPVANPEVSFPTGTPRTQRRRTRTGGTPKQRRPAA